LAPGGLLLASVEHLKHGLCGTGHHEHDPRHEEESRREPPPVCEPLKERNIRDVVQVADGVGMGLECIRMGLEWG